MKAKNSNINNKNNDNSEKPVFDYEKGIMNSAREENDSLTVQLQSMISGIKNESKKLNDKINGSIDITNEMDSKFTKSNSLMKDKVMTGLDKIMSMKSKTVCYAIIFIFVVCFFIYKFAL